MERPAELSPRAAWALLGAGIVVSAVVLLALDRQLSFRYDDWAFLLYRPGLSVDSVMLPHNEHISIIPVLVYKALIATAGTGSAWPFDVASTVAFVAGVAALFALLRERVGDWVALAAAIPVLFLGAAAEDLLWSFQIGYFSSVAFGLGAFLALERSTGRADAIACVLLVLSLASSSVGLAFAAGAAVVALGEERRRRAYVVAVPLVLYALWWLQWGHTAHNDVSVANVLAAPSYVLDGMAAGLGSLLGIIPVTETDQGIMLGRWLLAAGLCLAVWRFAGLGTWGRRRWVVAFALTALTFWGLAAFNANEARTPETSRYQYMGVVFVLLIAGELLRGTRPRTEALIAIFAVCGLATAANVSRLHDDWVSYRDGVQTERADLAAFEIARDSIDPDLFLTPDLAGTSLAEFVNPGLYLPMADASGSPAYSEAELAAAPEPARESADRVLAAGLRLAFESAPAGALGDCTKADGTADEPAAVDLPSGGGVVATSSARPVKVAMRRFASDSYPVDVGTVSAGAPQLLRIPADRSDVPWTLGIAGPARVCPAA